MSGRQWVWVLVAFLLGLTVGLLLFRGGGDELTPGERRQLDELHGTVVALRDSIGDLLAENVGAVDTAEALVDSAMVQISISRAIEPVLSELDETRDSLHRVAAAAKTAEDSIPVLNALVQTLETQVDTLKKERVRLHAGLQASLEANARLLANNRKLTGGLVKANELLRVQDSTITVLRGKVECSIDLVVKRVNCPSRTVVFIAGAGSAYLLSRWLDRDEDR